MNRPWTKRNLPDPTGTQSGRNLAAASAVKSAAWDTIIVGSSPLLMMEAIYLGRSGRRVLIVEDSEHLGGTWGRLDSPEEFPFLDIGCHYFDISRRAYEFLRTGIGLNLIPFRPQPQFAYRKMLFPFDNRQVIRVFRNLDIAVKRRALGRFVSDMFRDENYRFRMYPFTKTFMFPRGGSRELVSRLAADTRGANVKVLKSQRVEAIRFDQKRQRVHVGTAGETFDSKEIVAGSQAHIADALRITPRPEGTLRRTFTHVNLVFRDRNAPTFSYIRFLRHPAIIRMTEITDQIRHRSDAMDDYRVICIGIRDTYDRRVKDSRKVDELVGLLKQHRFVDPSARCEFSCWNRYPVEFLSDETQRKLQSDFAPMIRLIATTNFSVGVVNNVGRWESAFASPRILSAAPRSIYP